MRNSIQWCSEALFRVVLRLYAPSLRREFGDEIADATASRGFAGFRDVWSCVIRELPVVILNAMPWQLVGGLAVSTLLTCIGFWCLVAGTGVAAIGVM